MAKQLLLGLLLPWLPIGQMEAQQPQAGELAPGTCTMLEATVASAPNDFEVYRGTRITGNHYEATTSISGFPICSIVVGNMSMYACMRSARSEEEARRLYDVALDKVAPCVSGWLTSPPADADVQGLEMVQGVQFSRKSDAGEIGIGLGHARDTRTGQVEDSVSIVVTFKKSGALAS